MPLDISISYSPPSEYRGLQRVKVWKLKFSLFPRKCFLSNKALWGKFAYHGINWIGGPGEPVKEVFWIEKNEFLMWNLRGKR
jgi:hypothetical protein